MNKVVGFTFGLMCLGATVTAQANTGSSGHLRVIGTIKPAACTVTLTGGGTVDYATIPAASLPANDYYHLSEKPLPFSINCGSTATQVSLSIADSQSNSTVPGILGPGFPESQNFGLGMVGTKRTGGYSVRFMNLTATGSSLYPLKRVSQSAGWLYNSDGRIDKTPYQHSWSRSTAPTPALVSSVSGTLIVKAVINKANDLNLSQDVPLNGLATLVVARI